MGTVQNLQHPTNSPIDARDHRSDKACYSIHRSPRQTWPTGPWPVAAQQHRITRLAHGGGRVRAPGQPFGRFVVTSTPLAEMPNPAAFPKQDGSHQHISRNGDRLAAPEFARCSRCDAIASRDASSRRGPPFRRAAVRADSRCRENTCFTNWLQAINWRIASETMTPEWITLPDPVVARCSRAAARACR